MKLSIDDFFNNLSGCSFIKGSNFEFVSCSPAMAKQAGKNNIEEMKGLNDFELPWASYGEKYRADDQEVLQGRVVIKIEPFINAQKEKYFMLVNKRPFTINDKIEGIAGSTYHLATFAHQRINFLTCLDKEFLGFSEVMSYEIKDAYPGLGRRESEVLFHLLRDKSAKDIAKVLNISYRTVEKHIEVIKHKFKVKSKSELFDYVVRNDIISIIPTSNISEKKVD